MMPAPARGHGWKTVSRSSPRRAGAKGFVAPHVLGQGRALVKDCAEEREGAKHVRLVDAMHQVLAVARLAALGEPEREVEQPLGGLAGDHERLARLLMRHGALAHGPEQ